MGKIKYLYYGYRNSKKAGSTIYCYTISIDDYFTNSAFQKRLHNKDVELMEASFLDRNCKVIKQIELNNKSKSEVICELDSIASHYLYNF